MATYIRVKNRLLLGMESRAFRERVGLPVRDVTRLPFLENYIRIPTEAHEKFDVELRDLPAGILTSVGDTVYIELWCTWTSDEHHAFWDGMLASLMRRIGTVEDELAANWT